MPAKKKPSARTSKPKSKAKTPSKTSKPKTSKAKTSKAKTSKAKTTAKRKTPAKAAATPAPGAQTPTDAEVPTPGAPTEHEASQQEIAAATATTQQPPMPATAGPPQKTGANPLVIVLVVVGVLLLLGLGAIGFFVFAKKDEPTRVVIPPQARDTAGAPPSGKCGEVTSPEDRVGQLDNATRHQGSDDQARDATSKPPSSGIHGEGAANNRTIYDTPQPIGKLVHSMDHGSVIIWHSSDLSKDEYEALSDAANRNSRRGFGALIMVPYDDMKPKIALTAWGKLMQCDGVDDDAIDGFIEDFIATGPEGKTACGISFIPESRFMPEGHPRCAE